MFGFGKRRDRMDTSARRLRGLAALANGRVLPALAGGVWGPAAGDRGFTLVRSQATRDQAAPRRYVGRSGAPGVGIAGGEVARDAFSEPARTAGPAAAAVRLTWSLRLVAAVAMVCALGAGVRLTGILTAPVDPPAGVEATHAAFAQALAGRVEGALDPVRYFPATAPWHGVAPVDPAAGLPLYGWLVAGAEQTLGAGDWAGRLISILFGIAAGLALFGVVRRCAGARAALYALLFYAISPLSVVLGQQFSPASLALLTQALAFAALVRWRFTVAAQRPGGSTVALALAMAAGAAAVLVDPGSIFLAAPAAYLFISSTGTAPDSDDRSLLQTRRPATSRSWRAAWSASPNRGRFAGYAASLGGGLALWWLLTAASGGALALDASATGGPGATLASLLSGGTYVQLVGLSMEKLLTILGALLLFAGLLGGARRPAPLLFHAWLLGGLLHVLADANRIGASDDVLLPLVLPACALAGIGAAWAGSVPARIWLAVTEQRRDSELEYAVSPHTAWLLDLPEERSPGDRPPRPQAQLALGKSVAYRTQEEGSRARRAWVMALGNLAVLAALAVMFLAGWQSVQARIQPGVAAIELNETGREVAAATRPGSRMVIVGQGAPEVFYVSGRTGWALAEDDFGIARVQQLQDDGAAYLLSTDQEWLGRHRDYAGLLTTYSVLKLARGYILFDLNVKPAASDRSYFLQSGHTLGGEFKRFWETHGGVARLGYPISEEVREVNPLDGQERTVQYFERAVLEYHPELASSGRAVMLAAVGRWVTEGRDFPQVEPFQSTKDRVYFHQTGHSLKQAFLRYWQRDGGLAAFGYPISEELPEISPADGKVYTVQYFERARLEWHPTDAGTASEVQLGLIGKQAREREAK